MEEGTGSPSHAGAAVEQTDAADEAGASDGASPLICVLGIIRGIVPRRLSLSLKRDHALQATRVSIGKSKLVYLLIADKRLKYKDGKSRIAYIGTTKRALPGWPRVSLLAPTTSWGCMVYVLPRARCHLQAAKACGYLAEAGARSSTQVS